MAVPQISVAIADGHPLFVQSVARAIRQDPGFRLVAERGDGRAALEAIRSQQPDVAVLDVLLPVLDGRALLARVIQEALPTAVVFLSADTRPDVAFEALAAGARGYLSKRVDAEDVRVALRRVARGETVMCAEAQSVIGRELRLRHRDDRQLLSPREHEVLQLLAEGLTLPAIARRLQIAPTTVKSHTEALYERLDVSERAQAVAAGFRRGLLH